MNPPNAPAKISMKYDSPSKLGQVAKGGSPVPSWRMDDSRGHSGKRVRRVKVVLPFLLVFSPIIPMYAQSDKSASPSLPAVPTYEDIRAVAPALERYTKEPLLEDLWKRSDLSPRDRSLVTVAALIARNQTIEMSHHFKLALDNGVKPAELSEIITHLAFYSGWPDAMSAVVAAKAVFTERGIGADQLPKASPELLPIEPVAEERRAAIVQETVGPVSSRLVELTGELLFKDLWLRPDLAPRDRSLVTFSALIANGQVAQIPFHLNRAMDHGLTRTQAAEVVTHIAFYSGWPNSISAVPVIKGVFDSRPQ